MGYVMRLLVSIFLILLNMFISLKTPYATVPDAIKGALARRNARVMMLAYKGEYPPTQEGVMALAISTFAKDFTITSTLNGYTVLDETATYVKVWVDEAITIRWGIDSQFGNVDIITLKKVAGGYVPSDIQWWADLREYLYSVKNLPQSMEPYKDLVSWNKKWIPMLMMVPSVMLTSTDMNNMPCNPPGSYTPSVAARWMLSHTYPIGSFKVPKWYSTYFKYFPGDDCANSVSQSLYCGGMKTDDLWHPYTPAWIYVPKLWEYLIHHGWHRVDCQKANVGDILLFDVNHSGTPEHATLITGKFHGIPLYTAHTSHKKNMPIPFGDMWWCYSRR